MDDRNYQNKKEAARRIYTAQPLIHSPYFDKDIVLGEEGFQHLSLSAVGPRTKEEQTRRFLLLPLALHILKTATTLQAYRKQRMAVGTPGTGPGHQGKETVWWWAFKALFPKQGIMVGVVVRKVGTGKPHFWSVMLYEKPGPKMQGAD